MISGADPLHVSSFLGSAESLAWSNDGARLLVLVDDPGCYALEWSARDVPGAEPAAAPAIVQPGVARRRLFMLDVSSGRSAEVGPPETDVWEFDWDGGDLCVAIVSTEPTGGSGWYRAHVARLDLDQRTARTLYEPTWQIELLSLPPDGSRAAVTQRSATDTGP